MRKTDVWKIGKKAIAAIVVFAMVFSVFVGMNALNVSAGNAEKGIKSTVDVTGAPAPTVDGTISAGDYEHPNTWGDASSSDNWKAPGWLVGYVY
ncbi:MAG: hypothetical protein COS08_06440, partial [Euryarchaeota archaeon CG01_land_8_20_14_3_00_38_12]